MVVYKFGDYIKEKGLSWALGAFDAVHLAHQQLLSEVDAIITFNPIPEAFFVPNFTGEVRTLDQRLKIFENIGIKVVMVVDFCDEISKIKAEVFLNTFCKGVLPKKIVCGTNFRLGYLQEWGIQELRAFFTASLIDFVAYDLFSFNGYILSSSLIRDLVTKRQFTLLKNLLGYPYLLSLSLIQPYLGKTGWEYDLTSCRQVKPPDGVYRTNFGVVSISGVKLVSEVKNLGELEFITCL